MVGFLDGWMVGWMVGWLDGRVDRCLDGWLVVWLEATHQNSGYRYQNCVQVINMDISHIVQVLFV